MPKRPRPPGDWGVLYAELPKTIIARLEASANTNRRSRTAELEVLLDKALPPLAAMEPAVGDQGTGKKQRTRKESGK